MNFPSLPKFKLPKIKLQFPKFLAFRQNKFLWVIIFGILTSVFIGFSVGSIYTGFNFGKVKDYLKNFKIELPALSPLPKTTSKEYIPVTTEEQAVINVVKQASPAVVSIIITKDLPVIEEYYTNPFGEIFGPNSPFNIQIPQYQQKGTQKQEVGGGSGFIVSSDGLILTNKHVVSGVGPYTIVTRDGGKYEVKKIYRDPILDLAFVQVGSVGLKAVELGDSSKLKVGQTLIAIGNALGQFTNSVTTGVVSGLGRKVVAGDPFSGASESLDNLIQTDAAINPGNSGGPLLNSKGQVIGVNVATTEGAQNIGFAIPVNIVKPLMDEFIQKGSVSRPFLGVHYKFISRDVAILNDVPQGAYVQDVVAGGPAQKAGVKPGDIITKINKQAIDNESKLSEIVASSQIGSQLNLAIYRSGKEMNIAATLSDLPAQ